MVTACRLRSLIIIRALHYADIFGDEDVVKAVFDGILSIAMDVGYCQGSLRSSLLDLLVFALVGPEVVEESIAQFMELVATEEVLLQQPPIVAVWYGLWF